MIAYWELHPALYVARVWRDGCRLTALEITARTRTVHTWDRTGDRTAVPASAGRPASGTH
eukprot:6520284-Prymnesium_polylepis.1